MVIIGDEIVRCKACGGLMYYVENARLNEFWIQKVDTWVCGRCRKTIEEQRLDKKYVWK